MNESAEFLLTIGAILLLGLSSSLLSRYTYLPRVTILLVFGVAVGPGFLDLIPQEFLNRFEIIANMTLLMVGFLLGGKLTGDSLRENAGETLVISLVTALVTVVLVSLPLYLVGMPIEIAILLGSIASATAPAAVYDVVNENNASSRFSRLLLSVVAIDDVWALLIFAGALAGVIAMSGVESEVTFLSLVFRDVFGAVVLGAAIGLPAAFLTGRIQPGQPMLTEALGIVFLCGGLAHWFDVSFLIASMVMGIVIANVARHHEYPFHEIEGIEWPLMVIFFVLAGAALEIDSLWSIGLFGVLYIVSRAAGKGLGAAFGGKLCHSDVLTRRWMGPALLPQAGVAIGMALVASSSIPEYRNILIPIVISSTVFFEVFGPVFTRMALIKTNESQSSSEN